MHSKHRSLSKFGKAELIYVVSFGLLSFLCLVMPTRYAVSGEKTVANIILTSEQNDGSIDVLVGNILTVQLAESPTTGYVWINKTSGNVLSLEKSDFTPNTAVGIVGGAGQRTLRFVVSHPGRSTLQLKLIREWEGESSAVDVFSVNIHALQP